MANEICGKTVIDIIVIINIAIMLRFFFFLKLNIKIPPFPTFIYVIVTFPKSLLQLLYNIMTKISSFLLNYVTLL